MSWRYDCYICSNLDPENAFTSPKLEHFEWYSNSKIDSHCVKSVRIRSFSGPYFPVFGLNTERYEVPLHIQSKAGKYGPEKLQIWTLFTKCQAGFKTFYS